MTQEVQVTETVTTPPHQSARRLIQLFGQSKEMGSPANDPRMPHFFLVRSFQEHLDLAVILNTKRCAYQCDFCQLPAKSSRTFISAENILEQFRHVMEEAKHALGVLTRVSLGNEGSIFDARTMPSEVLLEIARCVNELKRVNSLVLETRLEFVDAKVAAEVQTLAPRAKLNILTGFETHSPEIRENILKKREPLEKFLSGLDKVGEVGAELTGYILFKPSYYMTDEDAVAEAERSIQFLVEECSNRKIPLGIRINPMYAASGSVWATKANEVSAYRPPRLSDVMRVAERWAAKGLRVYIGLSTEGLDDGSRTYRGREDFSAAMIKPVALFNAGKLKSFGSAV